MFLNFLIFLIIFAVLYFCYAYIEVNFQLKDMLEKGEYESLKSFCSKIKAYNQRAWHNTIFNADVIGSVLLISSLIYSVLWFSTYNEKSIKILKKNNVSVEFLKTYDRFGIERQSKFIENKYFMTDIYGIQYNKQYFKNLYKAGEDVSDYATISLDGEVLYLKRVSPEKELDNNYYIKNKLEIEG